MWTRGTCGAGDSRDTCGRATKDDRAAPHVPTGGPACLPQGAADFVSAKIPRCPVNVSGVSEDLVSAQMPGMPLFG